MPFTHFATLESADLHEKDRRARMESLDRQYPELRHEFERRYQDLVTQRRFFGEAGGYIIQGRGNLDLFELFCERYGHLARAVGYLGVVLPRSAFLVEGARGFRRWLFKGNAVRRVDFILNNRSWAFPIHPQYTIALVAAQRALPDADSELLITGPSASLDEFTAAASSQGVALRPNDLHRWTPAPADDTVREPSWEVPLLPTQAAATLFAKLRQGPRFDQGYTKTWKTFATQGDMNETSDKTLFKHLSGLSVWKGRSFDQYAPHGEEPAGFAKAKELEAFLVKKRLSPQSRFRKHYPEAALRDSKTLPLHHARIAFRDVSRATDSRTIRACLIPPETGLTNKAPYLTFPIGSPVAQMFVLGVLNSLSFDWQARRLVETNLNFFILNMLCFPPPERTPWERIGKLAARLSCVDERFAAFAQDTGVECGPMGDKRLDMLAEIDALVARAYGLDEADLYTIFQDFTEAAVSPAYRERVVAKFREV